ncbi:MAG: hypothetical protein JNJ88_00455 [Planctomycetes bacterium]|nr:hypothetical protein [Planctomycetota bacterium]
MRILLAEISHRRRLRAALLGGLFALFYLASRQPAMRGDGYVFVQLLGQKEYAHAHLLYLPIVGALQSLLQIFFELRPETVLQILSALCGGAVVGLTSLLANEFFEKPAHSTAAALLCGCLAGTWFHATATELHTFHAAFATAALIVAVRWIRLGDVSRETATGLFFCPLLLAGSHLSGISGVAAITLGLIRSRRRLIPAIMIAGGVATYTLANLAVRSYSPSLSGYNQVVQEGWLAPTLEDPGRIWILIRQAAIEAVLYSMPASILALAGLREIYKVDRLLAWMLGLWVLGYTAIALPIGDPFFGSYWVPTFPVVAILAVKATESWSARSIGALAAMGCSTISALLVRDGAYSSALSVAGGALLFMACHHNKRRISGNSTWLPATALCVSILTMPQVIFARAPWQDAAIRPRLEEFVQSQPPDAAYLVVESDPISAAAWHSTLASLRPGNFYCLASIDYERPDVAQRIAAAILERIRRGWETRRPVILIGDASKFGANASSSLLLAKVNHSFLWETRVAPLGEFRVLNGFR